MALISCQATRAIEFVEAHLEARFTVADVGRAANLSCSHFCREFKRTFGMSVHVYVMCRRIELAQHLMLTTDSSLSEIALRCGLSDQSHLTRLHRRVAGTTPGAWRRSCKGTQACAPLARMQTRSLASAAKSILTINSMY